MKNMHLQFVVVVLSAKIFVHVSSTSSGCIQEEFKK